MRMGWFATADRPAWRSSAHVWTSMRQFCKVVTAKQSSQNRRKSSINFPLLNVSIHETKIQLYVRLAVRKKCVHVHTVEAQFRYSPAEMI